MLLHVRNRLLEKWQVHFVKTSYKPFYEDSLTETPKTHSFFLSFYICVDLIAISEAEESSLNNIIHGYQAFPGKWVIQSLLRDFLWPRCLEASLFLAWIWSVFNSIQFIVYSPISQITNLPQRAVQSVHIYDIPVPAPHIGECQLMWAKRSRMQPRARPMQHLNNR